MRKITSYLIGLLVLPLLVGCGQEPVRIGGPAMDTMAAPQQSKRVTLAGAHDALSEQHYDLCASRFAAAARVSTGDESASCWYRASQCAARAGDYQTSRFHMQTAASAGFASLHELRADPLLRPLRSDSHWNLIDDLVKQNHLAVRSQKGALGHCEAPEDFERPLRVGATL